MTSLGLSNPNGPTLNLTSADYRFLAGLRIHTGLSEKCWKRAYQDLSAEMEREWRDKSRLTEQVSSLTGTVQWDSSELERRDEIIERQSVLIFRQDKEILDLWYAVIALGVVLMVAVTVAGVAIWL